MAERIINTQLIEQQYNEGEIIRPWQECSDLIYQTFRGEKKDTLNQQEPGIIALDFDNVVGSPVALAGPKVTHEHLPEALTTLQAQGVDYAAATARSLRVVTDAAKLGVRINAFQICEGGQVIRHNGEVHHIGHENLPLAVSDFRTSLTQHPQYRDTWRGISDATPGSVCLGAEQWRGRRRIHLYVTPEGDDMKTAEVYAEEIHQKVFQPAVERIAARHGVKYGRDITSSSLVLPGENGKPLAIVSITGLHEEKPIGKHDVYHHRPGWLPKVDLFIADGPGDLKFAQLVKQQGGKVIGVQKSADKKTPEVREFLRIADGRVADPGDLAKAVRYAAYRLAQDRQGPIPRFIF